MHTFSVAYFFKTIGHFSVRENSAKVSNAVY